MDNDRHTIGLQLKRDGKNKNKGKIIKKNKLNEVV